ncbi:hypothetical protein CY35_03G029600 [Sphagnum magellanicum]|nr:hypothetical protein CY35_03G029600 [Sphagnum magellanicum]
MNKMQQQQQLLMIRTLQKMVGSVASGLVRRSYCNSCRARSLFPVRVPLPIFQFLHMWSLVSDVTRVLLHQLLLSSRTGWLNASTNHQRGKHYKHDWVLVMLLLIIKFCRYPNDAEKDDLCFQTGISKKKLEKWFNNARHRFWKPLVEGMHNQLQLLIMSDKDRNITGITNQHQLQIHYTTPLPPYPSPSPATASPQDEYEDDDDDLATSTHQQQAAAPGYEEERIDDVSSDGRRSWPFLDHPGPVPNLQQLDQSMRED